MALTESRSAPARSWPALELLAVGGITVLLVRPVLARAFTGPAAQTWATIFVSLTIQALPFLVLGVLVSGAIAAFVPAGSLARLLPRRAALAMSLRPLPDLASPHGRCARCGYVSGYVDRPVGAPLTP